MSTRLTAVDSRLRVGALVRRGGRAVHDRQHLRRDHRSIAAPCCRAPTSSSCMPDTGLERHQVADATGYFRVAQPEPRAVRGDRGSSRDSPRSRRRSPAREREPRPARGHRAARAAASTTGVRERRGPPRSRSARRPSAASSRRARSPSCRSTAAASCSSPACSPASSSAAAPGEGFTGGFGQTQLVDRRRAARAHRLPDGRHQHRRHLRQGAVERGGRAAGRGHAAGVQRADARLQRRVRPRRRRADQRGHQVRHQPAARHRLRVPPQQRARRAQHLRRGGAARRSAATSSAARSADRSCGTACSSSAATRACATNGRSRATRGCPTRRRTRAWCPTPPACSRTSACIPPCGRTSICCFPRPPGRTSATARPNWRTRTWIPTDEDFWVGKIDWQAAIERFACCSGVSRDRSDSLHVAGAPAVRRVGRRPSTRYVTGQHQHLFSANVLNVLRVAANRTYRDNDLLPTVDIPTSLYFSEDPHWGAITVTGLVDCRLDGDDSGAVHAGRLPGGRHLHLGEGPPHLADGVRLAELSLRRVLVFALRRRVPLPQPHRVPHAAPQRHRPGGPVHRQPARHRHQAPRAAALRRRCSRRTTGASAAGSACRPGCATSS